MKAIFLGAIALAVAGCCTSSPPPPRDSWEYRPGMGQSGARYVECRPQGGSFDACAQQFREQCNGNYDLVPREHVRDYDGDADETVWVALCR